MKEWKLNSGVVGHEMFELNYSGCETYYGATLP